MITKFEDFIKEEFDYKEYKPLEGTCGMSIGKKDIEANVGDMVKFAKKYDIEDIEVSKLQHKGAWREDSYKKTGMVKPEGVDKWMKYKDLSLKQKKEFEDEINTTIDKSNLKYPIIVAKSKKGKLTILDGNHRVEKAHKLGKTTIKAYVIPEEDVLKEFAYDLKSISEKFLEEKKITKEYLKKESDGLCWWFAKNFSKYLDSKSIQHKIVDMMKEKKKGNHMVVKVGDEFVDFTLNQFKESEVPVILKKSDYDMFDIFKEYDSFGDFVKSNKMTEDEWKDYEKELKKP